jgi:poly-gamma-glutamate synthesis protein (capsule biosynthesis protein)
VRKASSTSATPVSFTIAATGDFLIHMPAAREAQVYGAATGQAYDFRPMTAKIKPIISSADLAICHVETPMSATDTGISGYPVFNTPHELADAIKDTGYEGCSVASNHSIDRGLQGVQDTLDALDRVGVEHAGTARSAQEATQFELHRIKGVTVAHLSYTYGTNGIPVPAGEPWLVNVTDVPTILAAAHRARQQGAQFVVVSMHWGNEYQESPTAEQQAQAQQLLASPDVDLILGDHVHVLQPVERIGDKYVIFGLGNLVSNQSPAAGLPASTQDGAVLKAYVRQAGNRFVADRVTYTPTYVEIGPYTIWPVAAALDDPSTPTALRPQLAASWRRTVADESSLPGHPQDAVPEDTPTNLP